MPSSSYHEQETNEKARVRTGPGIKWARLSSPRPSFQCITRNGAHDAHWQNERAGERMYAESEAL